MSSHHGTILIAVQGTVRHALSWDNLTYMQYSTKQYEESLASWKRKLELAPDDDRSPHWIETVEHAIAMRKNKGAA